MMGHDEGVTGVGGASRRAVLLGVGATAAAGVLAACGGDEPATPTTSQPGGGATTGGATSAGAAPTTAAGGGIKVADIPVGGGVIFGDRQAVVTQPTVGDFRAFDTTCPHQGCLVSEVTGGLITCPCHGSQFRIADGSVAHGPNNGQPLSRGLTAKNVTVAGDQLMIA